jgi:uncharacterized membrane protein YcaP (DUF421 family)
LGPIIIVILTPRSPLFTAPSTHGLYRFDTPLLEIIARGSIMYLALFALLRPVLKRESGAIGMTDLLVIVLLADAAQNGFWAWALDWLGYHVPAIQRLVHPPPLLLIRDGRLLRRNMQTELITVDELMSQLRLHGVDTISEVAAAKATAASVSSSAT